MSTQHEIRRLLDDAYAHDLAATARRRAAGKQLAALRTAYPDHWRQIAQLDEVTAEKLLSMARGK